MALQPPIEVHCGETTYRLQRLDQNLQTAYGLWCERDAWDVLQHTRQTCDERSYAILLIDHQRMKREQDFEIGVNTVATKRLGTTDGLAAFLRLAMQKLNPPMTIEQVKQLYASHRTEFDEALAEMFGQKKTGGIVAPAGDS